MRFTCIVVSVTIDNLQNKKPRFNIRIKLYVKSWVFNRNILINLTDVIEIFYESKPSPKVTLEVNNLNAWNEKIGLVVPNHRNQEYTMTKKLWKPASKSRWHWTLLAFYIDYLNASKTVSKSRYFSINSQGIIHQIKILKFIQRVIFFNNFFIYNQILTTCLMDKIIFVNYIR